MRHALAAVGRQAKASTHAGDFLSSLICRWQSTGRETCFGDIFDTTEAESTQPHMSPDLGVPGSMKGDTYLQEVGGIPRS